MGRDETEQARKDALYGFYEKLKGEKMHTETATITAQYVNQPKKNPAWGSIKDPVLGYIGVKAEHLNQFVQGQTYVIEYEIKGDFKGFTRIVGTNPATRQPQQAAAERHAPAPDNTALHIFITGVVGRSMQSGKFEAKDILVLTASAKGAWEQIVEGKVAGPPQDDIPLPSGPEDYQ